MEKEVRYASYPSLYGRVVIVTGGASGIAESIVDANSDLPHAENGYI